MLRELPTVNTPTACCSRSAQPSGSSNPELAALDVLIETATSRPPIARLLMGEGLAAGATGLLERDALIDKIEALLASSSSAGHVDLPTSLLVGGVFRFVVMRLQAPREIVSLREEIHEWVDRFRRPLEARLWNASIPATGERRPAGPRRPRGASRPVDARTRLLHATAAAVHSRDYRATSVADIVSLAGASRRSFYNAFQSKSHAAISAYEHGFHETVAACAPAFLGAVDWPDRVWRAAYAFTSFFAREPSFAYLGFVECYALGRSFEPRVHETQLAFTLFLEEGYRQREQREPIRRSQSMLTAAAMAEAAFQGSRAAPTVNLRRMQPLAAYIVLTPFIGADDALAFVNQKISG